MQTDSSSRQGGYSVRSRGLRFVNSTRRTQWTTPFNQIFLDLDGSLTGFANGTVIPYTGFNGYSTDNSGCQRANNTYVRWVET